MKRNRSRWFRRVNPSSSNSPGAAGRAPQPRAVWATVVLALCAYPASAEQEHKGRATTPTRQEKRTVSRSVPRGWEDVSAKGRTHAAEAARQDALEQLARRVEALRLSPGRRVKDFTAGSKSVAAGLRNPYKGLKLLSAKYTVDQICTVRARVSLVDVIAHLKVLNRKHGDGRFADRDFDAVARLNRLDTVEAIGQGVPDLADLAWQRRSAAVKAPLWAARKLRVSGTGRRPESKGSATRAKLRAVRAARAAARRALSDQSRGLELPGRAKKTVGDEIDRREELAEAFADWLADAKTVGTEWTKGGDAVVRIEADLGGLWDIVAPRRVLREASDTAGRTRKSSESKKRKGKSSSAP